MIRRLVFAVLVAILPLAGFAQQIVPISPVQRAESVLRGVAPERLVAVGVGVLVGAIGLHALLGGAAWTAGGAIAGGLFGAWWSLQRSGGDFVHKGAGATLAAR